MNTHVQTKLEKKKKVQQNKNQQENKERKKQTTFTYAGQEIKTITKLFKN